MDPIIGRIILLTVIIVLTIIIIFINRRNEFEEIREIRKGPSLFAIYVYIFFVILYLGLIIFFSPLNFTSELGIDPFWISIIILSLINFVIPAVYVTKKFSWDFGYIGILKSFKTKNIAIISIIGYFIFGVIRYFVLPPVDMTIIVLIVLFYSNAFLEEFLFRGIIQTSLEQYFNQTNTIFLSTFVFVLIHIPANLNSLFLNLDLLMFIIAFLFQFFHGFIFGYVYIKTRNLIPSIICHYFSNWLGIILLLLF